MEIVTLLITLFVCVNLYLLNRWLDIEQVAVTGGHLDHSNPDIDILRERGGSELLILLLNTSGKVYIILYHIVIHVW